MRGFPRFALGLAGRILAILVVAIAVEYVASTFLYERASQLSVRQDEAHRLAEHLVIARRLIEDAPTDERPAMAEELTTSRYYVAWRPTAPLRPAVAPTLDRLTHQITDWEPSLADGNLRLRITSPGRNGYIAGALSLRDSSWLLFRTRQPVHELGLSISRILLALTPAVALILIGALLVRHTLRPMRDLARAADRVGHGATQPVPARGPAEVRDVITAFNAMQDRIHRLIADRTQALAAVGHDFRTPLARLRLRADAIADDELRDAVQRDVVEMDDMVASLLAYLAGETEDEARTPADIAVMCATIADDAADHGQQVRYDGPDHCEMAVRRSALKRAITNLVDNALHYGGSADLGVAQDSANVVITVADRGPGIAEADLPSVTEPFVRLDTARARDTQGFGLGLTVVRRAVAAEGGTFDLANRSGGGLIATIRLPRG